MKLNRHNYEEYFILYLDNELGSEDRREVEAFASENPDLKAELDILLQSKASPDTDIIFDNKELLMAHDSSAISMNNYEEWLISYIDNELTEQETKDVERFVAAHPSVKKELELFQKTKLQPEAVAFPGIESLYRKEEKAKVIAISWRRIAVAAALLIGISTTAIVLLNKQPGVGKIDTVHTEPVTKPSTAPKINNETPANEQVATNTDEKKIESLQNNPINHLEVVIKKNNIAPKEKPEQSIIEKQEEPQIAQNDKNNKPTNNLPSPVNNPNVMPRETTGSTPDFADNSGNKGTLTNQEKKIVTTDPPPSSNDKEHQSGIKIDPDPDLGFASNDGKKNKLRGFFRKVTRTLEKRTNIKATDDDDDHLLIAGLSIKLN